MRFFLTEIPLIPGQPVDLSALAHQLAVVLRLHAGAQITLLDGQNNAYPTTITQLDRKRVTGQVLDKQTVTTEPSVHLTLYQCSLKADKFEWVLQKGTELGVAQFAPVISARSVVRPAATLLKKYDRWRTIIREAAEQCGRGRLPTLLDPLMWEAVLAHAKGLRLFPWEEARAGIGLGDAVTQRMTDSASAVRVNLLIGPEGGIAPEEAQLAQQAGWQAVALGPRVLRAETAAIVGSGLVLDRLGQMG